MHPIQHQLHSDHHHMQLLLSCLSQEIDCFDFDSQRSPDMEIIVSALDYFHVYPDKWHHPAEDVIFKRLLDKKLDEKKILEKLLREHEKISLETIKINQLFQTAADDCITSVSDLVNSAREFISLQRTHLNTEIEFIYPLFNEVFDADEWKIIEAEIKAEVKIHDDPLFNKISKKNIITCINILLTQKNRNKNK